MLLLQAAVSPPRPKPVVSAEPPAVLPTGVLALPMTLAAVALRAVAPSIDSHQSLDILLRTTLCMEFLIAALPDLAALDSLHITVGFEDAEEEPYSRMLCAVCAMPALCIFHLTDDSVMDHHILSLAAAFNDRMPLEILKMDVTPENDDPGGVFGPALAVMPNIRELHFMDGTIVAGGCVTARLFGRQFDKLELMRFDRMVFTPTDLAAIRGEWPIFPVVHTLQIGFDEDHYGAGSMSTIDIEVSVFSHPPRIQNKLSKFKHATQNCTLAQGTCHHNAHAVRCTLLSRQRPGVSALAPAAAN